MSVPFFDFDSNSTKRRRQINLGGISSATHASDILNEARLRRNQRLEEKKRQDSALIIQAWWRAALEMRDVRKQLRSTFEQDQLGTTGLRCLVLAGKDEEMLGQWSLAWVQAGREKLLQALVDPSWSTLLRTVSFLLLRSLSLNALSPYSLANVQVLEAILSLQHDSLTPHVRESRRRILNYLCDKSYYQLLANAILQYPPGSKPSPSSSLPTLVTLLTAPFQLDTSDSLYKRFLEDLFSYIFSIPLLPNRLIASLTHFARYLPLQSLGIVNAQHIIDNTSSIEARIHILANVVAFTPSVRISALSKEALGGYFNLTSQVMGSLPPNSLDPPKQSNGAGRTYNDDSDSDSESEIQVAIVQSFTPTIVLPNIDQKTRNRLHTIASPDFINILMVASQKHSLWPSKKDKILGSVLIYGGGGLVRECYRSYVRGSRLGQNLDPASLTDPAYASSWPPLLFLVDLYTQALLTMGDDEFFSTSTSSGPRNPLTLDELTSFSKQLLNIAFTLYTKEDQAQLGDIVPGMNGLKWINVRDKVTKSLQAIHARDSRKPFTPPDHWLVTSHMDVAPFVDAAIYEERQLNQPAETRILSKRQIASMSPRLGVLNNIPFAIPFDVRVSIFRSFIANDMLVNGFDRYNRNEMIKVTVRRGKIAQDGFDRLKDASLKAPIMISFIDQFGQEEAGIDGGGVFKEFLTSLCKEVFDTDRGLWLETKNRELYPNPHSYATESHSLSWYQFIGRILGKALYEGILVDVAFAGFFLAKWLGKQSFLDDLASLDPELYQGLIFLKHYPGNPEELSLNFTVAQEEFGVTKSIPLIPHGAEIPVTRENRLQYIYLVSHYKLNKQIKKQSDAFFEGLSSMIDPKWLRMFNQQELQILLGGVNSPIDLDDLRANTKYGGLYDDHEATIQRFWNVVNSFDQDQRRKLLRFATSCSRPPLLGFKELVPNFAIRDAGVDENRLPTASTCVNLLKLPRYQSERILREKLLQAINANAGFDLS
ncbi:HECT-domain-containing protein [Abortiporus biennis]|nr:HECT-domain-containing protein [Abortiporus biennis]